jgi:hypothetical protein
MDDALTVRLVQSVSNRNSVTERLRERKRAFRQPLGECRALEMLHHQEVSANGVAILLLS